MLTKETFGNMQSFQYDAINRITHVQTGRYAEQFGYDRAGNRTLREYQSLSETAWQNTHMIQPTEISKQS